MKKALLILFYYLLFTAHSSSAQKIRFTDTSNKWYCVNKYLFNNHWDPVKSSTLGTTIQNGITYSIYRASGDSALVRFDSTTNRVYIKLYQDKYYGPDTNEFVLYDFGLNIGDSFKTPHHNYIVRSKDSTLINGVKHYLFQIENKHRILYIIEGIGSINDPLMPYIGFFFEEQQKLVCFQTNNSFPKLTSTYYDFDNYISCKDTNGLSIEDIFNQDKTITISPNPANENSIIKLPYKMQWGKLSIVNAFGQTVLQNDIRSKEHVALGSLPATGLYFYKITDIQLGQSFTGKFVYE